MKKSDLAEFKKMTIEAIINRVKKDRGELTKLLLEKNMNKLKNTRGFKNKRKDIAQALTILNQKKELVRLEELNG